MAGLAVMGHNGQKNLKFGVYKNVCCGEEIVIPEGTDFPDCSKHRNLSTIWKPIAADTNAQLRKDSEPDLRRVPRFDAGDYVRVIGVDPNKGKVGAVRNVVESHQDFVHRYDVQFSDGASARYFGFQLELLRRISPHAA
jgi:hypothetical protein